MDAADPREQEYLEAARAVAAEDEERAGVATYLRVDPGPGTPDPALLPGPGEPELAARVRAAWDVLSAADADVSVQDVLAVLGDLDLRPEPSRAPSRPPASLAGWRPPGTPVPSRAARDAQVVQVSEAFVAGRLLRVVNHHDTPASRGEEFRRDLLRYAERFAPVTAQDVHAFCTTGRWPDASRPGIVPAFYDGFASAVQVAVPALEEAGLVGWFYPPTDFLDVPADRQREFARAHEYGVLEHPPGRLAMTWEELTELSARHEVCAHTATHAASADVTTPEQVVAEVLEPVRRLTAATGRPPASWAWLGGTDPDPTRPGDVALTGTGVRLWTSGTALRRLHR
ncbi:polysaccharide deacetylase family protein [Kineococcus sp. LSe6-4]|uniref:Polysaccharide deacetylase family protein n=1 Tax=Kineococcus halophytocola TaxID=3234027 RepID=A0ABV4H3F9_9ACTN